MNLEHYKAASEKTDEAEQLLIPPFKKAPKTKSPPAFPLPAQSKEKHRQSRVINRAYVQRWALDFAKTEREHSFTRVSESFLNAIEAATKAEIRNRILHHPSRGKTLL